MNEKNQPRINSPQSRLEESYLSEKPKLLARMRAAGRSLEEAEDMLHDVYLETMERLPVLNGLRSLPAWIHSLFTRRMIDLWRHEQVRVAAGETDVAEDTLREIISEAGFNPLEAYVRSALIDALNTAFKALPAPQRQVVEAQVFGGQTFAELAAKSGESIDTLKARKRYAVRNLSRALRHWVNQ